MGKIALCIPAFNAAWCLPRLLQSANAQLIPFDEILVYNDCSTDNTSEVAKSYGAKVIEGDINRGCSFGKNKLAEITNCQWIHFHDADDDLLPNFTQIAKSWINTDTTTDIVLLNFEYRDFKEDILITTANYNKKDLLKDHVKFILTNKVVNFAIIKRLSFLQIGGFNTDTKVLFNEDRAFYSRAVVNHLKFDYEPTLTCINYRYAESMSVSNQLKCCYAYYHVSLYLKDSLKSEYHKDLALNFWGNAKIAASFKDWGLTKKNIFEALKMDKNILQNEKYSFKIVALISPFFAFWLRENLIRLIKPHLRKHV